MSARFKVGDKVRVIADRTFFNVPIDKTATVEVEEVYPDNHEYFPEYTLGVRAHFPGAPMEYVTLLFREDEVERCE